MDSQTTNCLINAIDVVNRAEVLDAVGRDQATDLLRRVLDADALDDRTRLAKLAFAEREAKRTSFIQVVAKVGKENADKRLAAMNGERLRLFTSPLRGNRGADDLQALDSRISKDLLRVGAQMKKVYDLVADVRFGLTRDSERASAFVLAAEGGETTDKAAIEAARVFHETLAPWLERLREAGVWVDTITDYFPRSHNLNRIAADYDNWVAFMERHLDPVEHPDPRGTAEAVFRNLHQSQESSAAGATLSMSRKIHFDTPEAAHEYFYRFGDGNVTGVVHHAIENVVSKTLVAETFGPRALQSAEEAVQRIARINNGQKAGAADAVVKELEHDNKLAKSALDTLRVIVGDTTKPENQDLRNWSGAVRNWLGAVFLGKVALASIAQDAPNSMIAARFHTGGFMSGGWEQTRAFFDVLSNKDARAVVEELGVWTHAVTANGHNRFTTAFDTGNPLSGVASGATRSERALARASQASAFTQRVTGAQALERSLRSGFTLMASRTMNRLSKTPWAELPARYRDAVLRKNGITESDWEALGANAKVFRGTGALDTTALPSVLRDKIETAIVREAHVAVVHPNTYDRMGLMFGMTPGTWTGELAGSFTQFLSWPVSFWRNAVMREVQNGGAGAVGFAGAALASGVFTTQLYVWVDGQPMYEWDSPQLWLRGVTRSALLTPVGDAAVNALTNPAQKSLFSSAILDTTQSTLGSIRASAIDAKHGDMDKAAAQLLRTTEGLLVPNWWMTNALVNKGMDSAMDVLDPEYLDNRERYRERRGQIED